MWCRCDGKFGIGRSFLGTKHSLRYAHHPSLIPPSWPISSPLGLLVSSPQHPQTFGENGDPRSARSWRALKTRASAAGSSLPFLASRPNKKHDRRSKPKKSTSERGTQPNTITRGVSAALFCTTRYLTCAASRRHPSQNYNTVAPLSSHWEGVGGYNLVLVNQVSKLFSCGSHWR